MDRVIIDTNVFISGLLFGGNPEKVLQKWINREFILCISPELQAEIVSKLMFKFHASDSFIKSLIYLIENISEKYIPSRVTTKVRDKSDNFLLELAQEANAKFIISGDKDLLTLGYFRKTKIISPKDFIAKY